jgi:nitroreductase
MEFENVIKTRTSVRDSSQKLVEEEKISYVFECARLAPSWANSQCWNFVVIKNKKTIERISRASIINRWLKKVPVIIAACGDTRGSGSRNGINYFLVDVSIAMEHLVLAATDKGLGTCWIAGFDEKKVKEILEIPKHIRVVALTPLGYPADKSSFVGKLFKVVTQSKKRKSVGSIVHENKWGVAIGGDA